MPDAVWATYSTQGSGMEDCLTCGASVPWKNKPQHVNFHKNYSNRRGEDMGKVAWCDYGNHAFKMGEKGSATFSGTEYDENTGQPYQTDMDACAEHNPLNIARQAERYAISPEAYRNLNVDDKE